MNIVIEKYNGINVLRDDLLRGGTKSIIVSQLPVKDYVYASPVYGGFQIALAEVLGNRAHIVCAKRKVMHPNTLRASEAGACIHQVPHGYLSVVEKAAREFTERHGYTKISFGAAEHKALLVERAKKVIYLASPITEIWVAIGSGTLFEAILEAATPYKIMVNGVTVGKHYENFEKYSNVYHYPLKFERPARLLPPFPSMENYDAKAWEFCLNNAGKKTLFWNVL